MIIDDIVTCLTSDASLNSHIDGGIRHNHIDVNSIIINDTKTWLLFKVVLLSSESESNNKDSVQHYGLEIQCISQNDSSVIETAEKLKDYLATYDSGCIRDISLTSVDEINFDLEKKVWFKTTNYEILYIK